MANNEQIPLVRRLFCWERGVTGGRNGFILLASFPHIISRIEQVDFSKVSVFPENKYLP